MKWKYSRTNKGAIIASVEYTSTWIEWRQGISKIITRSFIRITSRVLE
jgi:hypothetical protein